MDNQGGSSHYNVFFRFGEDTRKTFTDHLHKALRDAGIPTFKDDVSIGVGEDMTSQQKNAIRQSRSSIIVFSKDYASSRWCLDGLCLILERKRSNKHIVLPIFYNVVPSDVRKQTGSVFEAFQRHVKECSEDEVKRWRSALGEASALAGMELKNKKDGHEAKFVEKIIRVIRGKLHQAAAVLPLHLIGIRSRAKSLNHCVRDQSCNVGVSAICGMGGIGKTTLAKHVYEMNRGYFDGGGFLEDVRDASKRSKGLIHLQKQLLSDILRGKGKKIRSVDEGIVKIQDALSNRRILLILDDVDHIDQLKAIFGMRNWFHPGSKIIFYELKWVIFYIFLEVQYGF